MKSQMADQSRFFPRKLVTDASEHTDGSVPGEAGVCASADPKKSRDESVDTNSDDDEMLCDLIQHKGDKNHSKLVDATYDVDPCASPHIKPYQEDVEIDVSPLAPDTDSENSATPSTKPAKNPFAAFAFKAVTDVGTSDSSKSVLEVAKKQLAAHKRTWTTAKPSSKKKVKPILKPKPATNKQKEESAVKKRSANAKTKSKAEWIPLNKMSDDEQEKARRKWHGLIVSDDTTSLEQCRYQVLVAARIHAQCHEASVKKALEAIHKRYTNFTVEAMAKADPIELASCMKNLQYHNVKSKQIVEAAQQIVDGFNGCVPEDEKSLLQLKGVGKVYADLLLTINTREAHWKRLNESVGVASSDSSDGVKHVDKESSQLSSENQVEGK